jgi:trans-aconitate methyltransferase
MNGRTAAGPRTKRTIASAAGVYDWLLAGQHHLQCDAEAAIELLRTFPMISRTARYNREFRQRAAVYMNRPELGEQHRSVRQFLDLGCGYPTAGNIHEIVRRSTVVYVDHDQDAVRAGSRILGDNGSAVCINEDISEPEAIFDRPLVNSLLDLSKPVGLLMVAVLPFVQDAAALVRRYVDRLARGSFVAITHPTVPPDERLAKMLADLQERYNALVRQPAQYRNDTEIEALFAGTEMVPHGLVRAAEWKPTRPGFKADDEGGVILLGGVGRIP